MSLVAMDYKLQIQNTRRVPYTVLSPDAAHTWPRSSALALWSRFEVQTLAFPPPDVYLHTAIRLSPKAMLMLTMFLQKKIHIMDHVRCCASSSRSSKTMFPKYHEKTRVAIVSRKTTTQNANVPGRAKAGQQGDHVCLLACDFEYKTRSWLLLIFSSYILSLRCPKRAKLLAMRDPKASSGEPMAASLAF